MSAPPSRVLVSAASAACAVVLTMAGAAAPAAAAADDSSSDSASDSPTAASDALFGEGDPTYDGVWRQSLALLAQDTAGYTPADEAVDWLLGQQCADGSYLSYRADTGTSCQDVTASDTNATAVAVQALAALGGHDKAVGAALDWLEGVQNEDGGWSYNPGGASDADSTALVIGAFTAADEDPADVRRDGATPYDALAALQLGCDAAEDERGAFAYQADADTGELSPNDLATADAVLASYGSGLLVDPDEAAANADVSAPGCEADGGEAEETAEETAEATDQETADAGQSPGAESGAAGAAYLTDVLAENDQHLLSAMDGTAEAPDYDATARAVIALAASGDEDAASGPLEWLQDNHDSWTDYERQPAALAMLVLAADAGGASAEDFGGTDLVAALSDLGPSPEETPGEGDGDSQAEASEGGGTSPLLWVVVAALAVGIAAGIVLSVRRSRRTG